MKLKFKESAKTGQASSSWEPAGEIMFVRKFDIRQVALFGAFRLWHNYMNGKSNFEILKIRQILVRRQLH